MSLMNNLVTEADQRRLGYDIRTDQYNFDISINGEGLLCIVANLDFNFLEWVSLGEITNSAEDIGDCINHIISESPNGWHAHPVWAILGRENIDRVDYRHLWLSTKITKRDGLFVFRDEELDFSSKKIGEKIIEFYTSQLNECKLLEKNRFPIIDYLSSLCSQLEECSRLDNASLGYSRSKGVENPIGSENLKCLALSENQEVQDVYKRYNRLVEGLYQAYMNEARG